MSRFRADPLDLRGWPAWSRVLAWLLLSCAFCALLSFTIHAIAGDTSSSRWLQTGTKSDTQTEDSSFSNFAWSYLATATLLTSWFTADAFFARRTIYARFGLLEGTLKHGLRFWRRVGFLTLVVTGLGITLLEQLGSRDSNGDLQPQVASAMAVLVGAYFASFGWMYTRFEQEKSDRASATLEAIRDQMYNPEIAKIYQLLLSFSAHCVNDKGTPGNRPFNQNELKITTGDGLKDANDYKPADHKTAATFFLSSLDQLALGVRKGQFDLGTIQLILRERFIRFAFRYYEVIHSYTDPEPHPKFDRMRARTRTYEHFLWLTSKMDLLATDLKRGASWKYIILPPDHIVGTQPDQLAPPPVKRETSASRSAQEKSPFWERLANWPHGTNKTAAVLDRSKSEQALQPTQQCEDKGKRTNSTNAPQRKPRTDSKT